MKLRGNGTRVLVETFKTRGISKIFGVSGSDVLPVLDLLYQEPKIDYIQAQHEQGAIYMANGYARASHDIGISIVSPGPGITNSISGVAQAFYTSTPSLLIGIEEASRLHGLGHCLHHDLETIPMLQSITKLCLRVERADRITESLIRAFRTAASGRKGPVYIGIPKDFLNDPVEVDMPEPERIRTPSISRSDSQAIMDAVDLLSESKSPVALAGGGLAWAGAQERLLDLAERLAMPVAATRHHKGIIPEDHPLALGTLGFSCPPLAAETLKEADILLAVGCTFEEFTTKRFEDRILAEGAKIIQIDIDPMEIGKIYPVHVGICGDALLSLEDILKETMRRKIDRRPIEQSTRIKNLLESKRKWQDSLVSEKYSDKVPIQRFRLFHDLRKALPRDAIVAGASGGTNQWFHYAFEALAYNYAIGGWHPLGSEYPEIMGVKTALPDRLAVCITGDGAIMMTLPEIATAVAYNIPVICVVCHNSVYGNMRKTQIQHFGGRFIGTDLNIPNLANIANEFGAYGEQITEPEDIIPAVERAIASGKPSLLDVLIDSSPENLSPPSKP